MFFRVSVFFMFFSLRSSVAAATQSHQSAQPKQLALRPGAPVFDHFREGIKPVFL